MEPAVTSNLASPTGRAGESSSENEHPYGGEESFVPGPSETMASLAIGAAATAATSHARSAPPGEQICVVCLDSHHLLREVITPCGHFFCRSCLNEAFFFAAKDESLFPPKCCQQALPTDLALPFVSVRIRCAFENAKREFGPKNRVYCYKSECSTFLGGDFETKIDLT